MKDWYFKVWKERNYFDLWHINHLLAGILLAGLVIFFDFGFLIGIISSLIIMVSWEIFEILKKVKESNFNRAMDIILGVVGFFILYFIQDRYILSFFTISFIVWTFMELWGYSALYIQYKGKND